MQPRKLMLMLLGLGASVVTFLLVAVVSVRVSSQGEISLVPHDRDVRWLMEHPTRQWRTLFMDYEWRIAPESPDGYLRQYGQLAIDAPCRVRLLGGADARSVEFVSITTAERVLFVSHDATSLLDRRTFPCPSPENPEALLGGETLFSPPGPMVDHTIAKDIEIDYRAGARMVEVAGRRAVEATGTERCASGSGCAPRRIVMAVDGETGMILRWTEYLPNDPDTPLESIEVLHLAFEVDLPNGFFDTDDPQLEIGMYQFEESSKITR